MPAASSAGTVYIEVQKSRTPQWARARWGRGTTPPMTPTEIIRARQKQALTVPQPKQHPQTATASGIYTTSEVSLITQPLGADPRAKTLTPLEQTLYQQFLGDIEKEKKRSLEEYGTVYTYRGGKYVSIPATYFNIPFEAKKSIREWELRQRDIFFETVLPEHRRTTTKQRYSKAFYETIGFPQFGGKYEPFKIPKGSKVTDVKEVFKYPDLKTPTGLSVTLESTEQIEPRAITYYDTEGLPPNIRLAIEMEREFGPLFHAGRLTYASVRPDIQEGRFAGMETQVIRITPSYWYTPLEPVRKMNEPPPTHSYWQRPISKFRFTETPIVTQTEKQTFKTSPKFDREIINPMTGKPLSIEQKKHLFEVGQEITQKNYESYVKARTPLGPLAIPSVTPTLKGIADIVSGRDVGIQTIDPMRSSLTGKPQPMLSGMDVAVGFVKGAESLVNPNTRSYWDIFTGEGTQYLKSIEGREGEFLGEIAFDVVLTKGLGAVGKAVGLSGKALLAGAALNIGVSTAFSAYQVPQTKRQMEKQFESSVETAKLSYYRSVLPPSVAEYRYLSTEQKKLIDDWEKQERELFYGETLPTWERGQYATIFSPRTMRTTAYAGAGEAIIGGVALRAIAQSGRWGERIASSILGRAAVDASIDAGIEGVMSKGDPIAIARGATFGAVFSVGFDVSRQVFSAIKVKLPSWLGGAERLELGEPTTGKAGQEIPTYVSKTEFETLGGRRLRVVPDVSERIIGTQGVSLDDMVGEYVGRKVPTGHATLDSSAFDLTKGGKTLLKGFPTESAGFRKAQQLYHFYSAPGSSEFVTLYGGYIGVGEGYSDEAVKVVFGGKPTALVTTDTQISSEFLRRSGESLDDYLFRTSMLSGKTGIAQETIWGKSPERQFVTPAAYERFDVDLPGSLFVSEGKIGTFQIKQEPSGLLGKIPGVRSLFSRYTDITVYKGGFAPVPEFEFKGTELDVKKYGASYTKTFIVSSPIVIKPPTSLVFKSVETSKIVGSPTSIPSVPSAKSLTSKSTKSASSYSLPSIPSSFSLPSIKSKPSVPSVPSIPSVSSIFSVSSKLSVPSLPSLPSAPSVPSVPSFPSYPSPPFKPSYPSIPDYPSPPPSHPPPPPSYPQYVVSPKSILSTPFVVSNRVKRPKKGRKKDDLFGGWRLKTHPIPTMAEISKKIVGVPLKKKRGRTKLGKIAV